MSAPHVCSRCGAPTAGSAACSRCLLETVSGQSLAERIFQAALSLDPAERAGFVQQSTAENAALGAEVQLLLAGYEEAGGDNAGATFGGTARERWAAVRREEPGTLIDHFRLVRVIGEGGMGSVWEAEQSQPIRRRVALKIIKLGMDTEEVVRRFERERRTLALMAHPHIAQVFEAGATPAGRPYFAMELVEGLAITTHCIAAGLGVQDRLRLFLDVCAAVEHAHQKGVIHRDLKPSNILVSDGVVKVIDFGVAKATRDESGDALFTRAAQVLGTPAYMSPEQASSGGLDVDTRSDVYSLGAVLYELLSGALPFDPQRLASTHLQEVQRILREEPPPRPSTRLTGTGRTPAPVRQVELHGDLDWIILKALSKERERRYPGAAEFAADIRRYLDGEAVSAVPPTLVYRFGKFVRRNKAAVAAGAAVLTALTAGLAVSLVQVRRANEALAGEARARTEATNTVADLYTRSGISAAEDGAPDKAALWFTRAAQAAADDPERAAANRLRAAAWTAECSVPVAAFDTGMPHIEHMAFHPDGNALLVTQIDRGPVQVWNLLTEEPWAPAAGAAGACWNARGDRICIAAGDLLRVLEYPSGRVLAEAKGHAAVRVAFNPEGNLIAAGTSRPEIWDWQAGTFRAGPDIPGGTKRVTWSPDGELILWQTMDRAAVCLAAQPDQLLFPAVDNTPKSLAGFTAGGTRFFHAAQGVIHVRDSRTGAQIAETTEGEFALAATADGTRLARATAPPWEPDLKTEAAPARVRSPMMESGRFSPDGTRLVTSSYDAAVRLWDPAQATPPVPVGNHQLPVQCVEWSPDGKRVASSQTGLVRIWKLPERTEGTRIPVADDSLAVLSPDGKLLVASGLSVAGSGLRATRVCDASTGQPAGDEIQASGVITGAAIAPGNEWIALAVSTTPDRGGRDWDRSDGGSGVLEIHSIRTGQLIGQPVALPSEPRAVAVHPDGESAAVYCGAGEGLEWDRRTGTLRGLFNSGLRSQPRHTLNNGSITYSADGRFLIAWGQAGALHVWDRTAGRAVDTAQALDGKMIYGLAVSGGLAALAPAGPAEPELTVINLASGAVAAPPLRHSDWLYHTEFDETGRYLISSGRRPVVQVWDWQAGTPAGPALPHASDVMAALFVPGTPWVITGAHDGYIRFWDRRTGMLIRPPLRRPGLVVQLTLTPDARHLIVAALTGHGHLEVLDLPSLLPSTVSSGSDPQAELLAAEIIAAATIHQSGGILPLTGNAWLEKWHTLRRTHPAPSR